MAKRKDQYLPWPDTVWHTSGRMLNQRTAARVRKRLDLLMRNRTVRHWTEIKPDRQLREVRWWWGADASWLSPDGARVKARLLLAPDPMAVQVKGLTEENLEEKGEGVELFWSLTAEADRPWDVAWPSPLDMMFPPACELRDWAVGRLSLRKVTYQQGLGVEGLQSILSALSVCSWYTTVIVHDREPFQSAKEGYKLLSVMPDSFQGRLVELRVYDDQDQIVNAALQEHRVSLPWGGAVIVPAQQRDGAWPLKDFSICRPPGGGMEQLLKETSETVLRYSRLQPHLNRRESWHIDYLRECWGLPELEVAPQRLAEDKRLAEEKVEQLNRVVDGLRAELAAGQRCLQEVRLAKEAVDKRLQEMEESPLQDRAREAEEAWAALEESDALAERLTGEVAWLRRQLAQVPGRSYAEPVPVAAAGPASWEELLQLAAELLPQVNILGSVKAPLEKLYGHTSTPTWLRRAWAALEALDAYAEAKAEHGAVVLPRFSAYLEWPKATVLIPKSMWAASEVSIEHAGADRRVRRTRMFTVPGVGEVFMGAHVRIGSGGSPAPRMHLYDDTSGPTGKVHVGYIGPHLPNAKGR